MKTLSGALPWAADSSPTSATPAFAWNGAVGLAPDISTLVTVTDLLEGAFPVTTPATTAPGCPTTAAAATALGLNTHPIVPGWTDAPLNLPVGSTIVITNGMGDDGTPTPTGYAGTWTI